MLAKEIAIAERLAPTLQGVETINLDDYSVDPMEYAALEWTLDKLSCYCEAKRKSMQLRIAGDIECAGMGTADGFHL